MHFPRLVLGKFMASSLTFIAWLVGLENLDTYNLPDFVTNAWCLAILFVSRNAE